MKAAIVLAALCALLVTSIGSVSAMAAGPRLLDVFGNPICADGSLSGRTSPDHGNGQMPDCCVLACAGLQVQSALAPQSPDFSAPAFAGSERIVAQAYTIPARADRTPANPRAPPAA